MMKNLAIAGVLFALAIGNTEAAAQNAERPLLHPLFQDHAVLQRDQPLRVWGWAAPGARVTVQLDDAPPRRARADRLGAWQVMLPTLEAGGPHTLRARTGEREQIVSDVLAGDVFLCSGQSNMEFLLRSATNSEALLREPSSPRLRLFHVARWAAGEPQETFGAANRWAVDSPQDAGEFSAVCYLFGRAVQRTQTMPVGLISASWGGTPIEAWMSAPALRSAGRGSELELAALHARDADAAQAQYSRQMREWWRDRDRGFGEQWSAPDYDDASWAQISPSGFWENTDQAELARLDGIVWFRTAFTLSAAQAALGGQLELGPADDIDVTFVNGQEVGGVAGWDTPRVYEIAPGVLREGRNVLAASVLDTGGGGGFWGAAEAKALRLSDGTRIALSAPWRFRVSAPLDDVGAPPRQPWGGSSAPSVLFNGMIAPLRDYGVRAALWYQGETNAGAPQAYERLLPGLFEDWRALLGDQNVEFYVVQLSAFGAPAVGEPTRGGWGRIRDVQRRVVAADENAALAVSIDLGDRYDIHPTQKLVLAERLARLARRRLYGENIEESGPLPAAARREGREIRVSFIHGPLAVHSGRRPISFELCTEQRVCRFVDARAHGAQVSIEGAADDDVFVRYCWGDSPICNLFNDADLPASPFELAIE